MTQRELFLDAPIIGLTGFKAAGKTTIAKALDNWKRVSFADRIRKVGKAAFGLTDEQMNKRELKEAPDPYWNKTPRTILQEIGIMFREKFGKDFWIQALEKRLRDLQNESTDEIRFVIDDVRFPNEATWVRSQGVVIGLNRTGVKLDSDHPTETKMAEHWDEMIDAEVQNDDPPEDVAEVVLKKVRQCTST